MVQLLPIVLAAIALEASGHGNPSYGTTEPLQVSCSIPAADSPDVDGTVYWPNRIYFQPYICERLNSFARSPIIRGDDHSDSANSVAWVLRVAVHEASHIYLQGTENELKEKQADCRAVTHVYAFARALGASKATAARIYRLNTKIVMEKNYRSACSAGHSATGRIKPPPGLTPLPTW